MASKGSRRRNPDHPPYALMISTAILSLAEEGGSMEAAISQYIQSNFDGLPPAHDKFLPYYLCKLTNHGEFVAGANGRYRLPEYLHPLPTPMPNNGGVRRRVQSCREPGVYEEDAMDPLGSQPPKPTEGHGDRGDGVEKSSTLGPKPTAYIEEGSAQISSKTEANNGDQPTASRSVGDDIMMAQSELMGHGDKVEQRSGRTPNGKPDSLGDSEVGFESAGKAQYNAGKEAGDEKRTQTHVKKARNCISTPVPKRRGPQGVGQDSATKDNAGDELKPAPTPSKKACDTSSASVPKIRWGPTGRPNSIDGSKVCAAQDGGGSKENAGDERKPGPTPADEGGSGSPASVPNRRGRPPKRKHQGPDH